MTYILIELFSHIFCYCPWLFFQFFSVIFYNFSHFLVIGLSISAKSALLDFNAEKQAFFLILNSSVCFIIRLFQYSAVSVFSLFIFDNRMFETKVTVYSNSKRRWHSEFNGKFSGISLTRNLKARIQTICYRS